MSISHRAPQRKSVSTNIRKHIQEPPNPPPGETKPPVRLRLRAQLQRATDAPLFEGEDVRSVFERVLIADVSRVHHPVIEVVSGELTFLDLDTHHLNQKPIESELDAWAEDLRPAPDMWWRTHGRGLRAVFCGEQHEACAIAAALSVPRLFEVELKRGSRHPAGTHPRYSGAVCGPVHRRDDSVAVPKLDWTSVGRLDPAAIDSVLAERGMERGLRYDHSFCPIDGGADSTARACVVANDAAIFCFRCQSKGLMYDGCSCPGLVPLAALSDNALVHAVIHELARHFVHWTHAELHLRDEYPNVGATILKKAYDHALRAIHPHDDPRIGKVFDPDLRVVQGENAWFDRVLLAPVRVTEHTLNSLPALLRVATRKNGQPQCCLRAPLVDRVKAGIPLDGYKPVLIHRGVVLHQIERVIQLAVPPAVGAPVRLLTEPSTMSEDGAFAIVGVSFPGLSRSYLKSAIAAAICAERGGRPPILFAVGPTGSGKGETVQLAASFLGDERQTVPFVSNGDQQWRRIGSAVESGHRFLMIDEILRRGAQLSELTAWLLQMSSKITWRRLYQDGDVITINRSAFFLAAGCVPDGFKKSPEVRRRMWLARLFRQVEEWNQTCGGDTADWRGRSDRNADAANSILTNIYRLCAQVEFNFDRVARVLGLCRIDEGDAELQHDVLRRLYRHCRNEFGDCQLHTASRYLQGRWIDALSRPCQDLLEQLVRDEDTDQPDAAKLIFQLQQNLQMVAWNRILGILDPSILCEMRGHGGNVVIRFREAEKMRGQAAINEDLPPIPDNDGLHAETAGLSPSAADRDPETEAPASLCPFGQPAWQNGKGAEASESTKSEGAGTRSASNASSASTFLPNKKETKEGKQGASTEAGNRRPGTLAEQAERAHTPKNAAHSPPGTLPILTERVAERAPDDLQSAGSARAALLAAGFPIDLLVLDFETFFAPSYLLKKLTAPEYVLDPRFHVHGLAIRHPDGQCDFVADAAKALADMRSKYGERLSKVTVVAHNMHFDGFILTRRFNIRPEFITDTLALARHVYPRAGNSLADLAKRLGLPPKGTELSDLSGVRELSAARQASLAVYAKHDAELCYAIALRLLPQISRPEVELKVIDHTARLFIERGIAFDTPAAEALLKEASDELDATLAAAGVDRKTAGGAKLVELLEAELVKEGRCVPTKAGKNGDIPALAKSDVDMKHLLVDANERVRKLARARIAVKSTPQTEKRLQTMIRIAERAGGELPVPLNYCGAHTGRFSGADRINLQNLGARADGVVSRIRGLLHAGEDHRLVVVDASQIEARVLAWLAGQARLVEDFRSDKDVYCEFASSVFGEGVRKPREDDPPEFRVRLKARRQLGKVAVLGLGYQMGVDRFVMTVKSDPDLAAMLDEGTLSEAFLASVHSAYRTTYAEIPKLWNDMQHGFHDTLFMGRCRVRQIEFWKDSDVIHAELPSGRRLFYRDPEFTAEGELSYSGGKLYGGLLVENVVQAIARDVLVEAVLALEARAYQVVLTVHDEIVLRSSADTARQALSDAIDALSRTPDWASGLPLAAEGRVTERYGK